MAAKRMQTRYAVVVGFDFYPPSEAALREAIDLAGRRPGGEVHVVFALDAIAGAAGGRNMTRLDTRIEKATAKLRAYVTSRGADLAAQANPSFLAMHVCLRAAAPAIVQAAVDLDADLIVVGAHHPNGLQDLVRGSTADEVTKTARCPVLLVKPKNYTGLTRSPTVEPQCPACVARRLETRGATWWCRRHEDRVGLPIHIYSYSLSHPSTTRDTDVEGPGA